MIHHVVKSPSCLINEVGASRLAGFRPYLFKPLSPPQNEVRASTLALCSGLAQEKGFRPYLIKHLSPPHSSTNGRRHYQPLLVITFLLLNIPPLSYFFRYYNLKNTSWLYTGSRLNTKLIPPNHWRGNLIL